MSGRVFIDKQTPVVFKALSSMAQEVRAAAESVGLPRKTMELVNVRVSQLNRCLFCLNLHSRLLLEAGDTSQRLAVLPVWEESDLFDDKERAALALAEAVTRVTDTHLSDAEYAAAARHLSPDEISVLAWAAIAINAFNRVSIISKHPVKSGWPSTPE
ncbi:carboxymuconolactone decarboxylase family protein [Skermania sp. ID1734]|uniref:carboxymuconolactone decarboxylase family protein n=1 Tax=Skermania sp. ID1734 TaxID=2597516 RepID=UPI002103B115|nr:carboxymuconolactone decarboxylase family protein [Skermania sp. ID1734]